MKTIKQTIEKIKQNIYSITRRIIAIKKANGLLKIFLYLIFCIPVLPFIVFTFILGVISYLNEKVEKLLDYLDDLVYTAGRFMIDKTVIKAKLKAEVDLDKLFLHIIDSEDVFLDSNRLKANKAIAKSLGTSLYNIAQVDYLDAKRFSNSIGNTIKVYTYKEIK